MTSNQFRFAVIAAVLVPAWASSAVATAAETRLENANSNQAAAMSCAQLASVALPNATITQAESVAAGQYKLASMPFDRSGMNLAGRIQQGANPAFCRIAATLKPSADSNIKIEVWLPESGWNGKFLGVANFGWGGSLMYSGMLTGLQEGYATASTDTGHSAADGPNGQFALGHPEKIIDYAYRATHEMTVAAKSFVKSFYGRAPARSYMIGCSLGGLESLIEAKRYPEDYDGMVIGAPPNPITRFNALQLWPSWLVSQDPRRFIPREKYAMVHRAVVQACASPIGKKDAVVDEPDKCSFDPKVLQCKGAETPECLTAPQVELLQKTYQGPVNPRTGEVIFPGPARGTELEMFMFAGTEPMGVALDLFRYAAFQNADWTSKTMDWDKDVNAAIDKVGPLMHVDSNLKPFFDRGGKMVFYIGWNDYHNPQELIGYYQSLLKNSGSKVRNSTRLFTIPGMGHCAGGNGCDTFNKLGVIDAWFEQDKAPERILAAKVTNGNVVRTRPLCAYPKVAKYLGSGDSNDATNFTCGLP